MRNKCSQKFHFRGDCEFPTIKNPTPLEISQRPLPKIRTPVRTKIPKPQKARAQAPARVGLPTKIPTKTTIQETVLPGKPMTSAPIPGPLLPILRIKFPTPTGPSTTSLGPIPFSRALLLPAHTPFRALPSPSVVPQADEHTRTASVPLRRTSETISPQGVGVLPMTTPIRTAGSTPGAVTSAGSPLGAVRTTTTASLTSRAPATA